jgi:CBS domain-containing protein
MFDLGIDTDRFIIIDDHTSLREAHRLFLDQDIDHLVIVDKDDNSTLAMISKSQDLDLTEPTYQLREDDNLEHFEQADSKLSQVLVCPKFARESHDKEIKASLRIVKPLYF